MPDPISADAVSALMPALRGALREAADLALPFFRRGVGLAEDRRG